MAAFWLLQALTGMLLAFRWELDDALLAGSASPADAAGLGARVEAIERGGGTVVDLWASSGASVRFDIYYRDAAGTDRVTRVDGTGVPLRDGPAGQPFANGGVFNTLTRLHSELLAGDRGRWVIGASGILLFTHMVAGLRMAWPRVGGWRRALIARPVGTLRARAFVWHRAIGLWAVLPALPLVCAGVLLAFENEVEQAIAPAPPAPVAVPGLARIGAEAALAVALARRPGAALSMMSLPTRLEPWYRIRVRLPDDLPRNWGTTVVFVSAADGSVLAEPAADAGSLGRQIITLLHPLHTGQIARLPGRLLVLAVGAWLAAMVMLGLRLRCARRQAEASGLVPGAHRASRVL